MARTLTKKQRGFVNYYADTGNGTRAALANYDTEDERVAEVIGSENLSKPIIQEELKKLGFNENTAKQVVGKILTDETAEHRDRLKAADMVFSVESTYAPLKTQALNLNIEGQITAESGLERIVEEVSNKLKSNKT